jgi:hypothetical protein
LEFHEAIKAIPTTPEQKSQAIKSGLLSKRLHRFGDFNAIDTLAKTYPQYTHDDLFNAEIVFVHNLLLLNREQDYIAARMREK